MLHQQRRKKVGVEPAEIPQRIGGRIGGLYSQLQRRIAKRKHQVDQCSVLPRFLRQRYCKLTRNGGDAGSTFRAHKHQQLSLFRLRRAAGWQSNRCANQRFGKRVRRKGPCQKFPRARPHASHHNIGFRALGIHHHRRRAFAADALHQIESTLFGAVHVNNQDVEFLRQQVHHVGEIGIRPIFADHPGMGSCKRSCHFLAPPLIRANQRDLQIALQRKSVLQVRAMNFNRPLQRASIRTLRQNRIGANNTVN